MKNFSLPDLMHKRLNSVIFRLIVTGYSILILIFNINLFDTLTYVIIIIAYLTLYTHCFNKSIGRLINDFVFMIFICVGKNPSNIEIVVYLLLPIINAVNFSGKKGRPFVLYSVTLIVYLTLYFSYFNELDINAFKITIPIIFLAEINRYTHKRVSMQLKKENLISIVDNFNIDSKNLKRPYKVYDEIKNEINTIIEKNTVQNIYCFKISNDEIAIVNGTSFIWNFEFTDSEFVRKLRIDKYMLNCDVAIEDRNVSMNFVIYTKIDKHEYFYLFTLNHNLPPLYHLTEFFSILTPSFNKVTKIILSQDEIQKLRSDEVLKLSQKRQYVARANGTMHFIRNRLSPFSNLIAMLETLHSIPSEKKEEFTKKLHDQNNTAKNDLREITKRADIMLENSENPFFYSILHDVSVGKIFSILKRSCQSYFPENVIESDILNSQIKQIVKINEEGFEIFLSDWLNNIKKYYVNYFKCKFTINEQSLYISFENNHSQSKEEIKKIVRDLTSNDRNEIIKRTTHGLYTIKSLLSDMAVDFTVHEENNILTFTIVLKITT